MHSNFPKVGLIESVRSVWRPISRLLLSMQNRSLRIVSRIFRAQVP